MKLLRENVDLKQQCDIAQQKVKAAAIKFRFSLPNSYSNLKNKASLAKRECLETAE